MRVLIFPKEFPSAHRPNAGIFILRQAQALRTLGHDIEVVRIVPYAPRTSDKWRSYSDIPALEYVDDFPVRTIRAIVPPRMIGMEYLPLQVHGAIQRAIERFKPDLLHASFLIPCGQIAVRQQIPTVVTAHGGDAYLWPTWRRGLHRAAREAISRATRVTAVSDYIRSCVQAISTRDVEVILNGADERFFFPRERSGCRTHLGLPQDRLIVAFAGNIFLKKGVFDLIKAAAGMAALRPLIAMAGEGPHRAAAEALSREAAVEVRFLGRLDSQDVSHLFGAADIVTLPSHNEGLPNVLCEAMLCGRAVVATEVGGIPEIVKEGQTGLLVPKEQPDRLRQALERVAGDRSLRERFESAAHRFAEANLTWRISAKGYERVYEQAIAR